MESIKFKMWKNVLRTLTEIHIRVSKRGIDSFTKIALLGIDDMGLTQAQGLRVVLDLHRSMLFKSMTTHADHRVWQDVYHAPGPNGRTAYIKVAIQQGATVIQFKER